MKYLAITLLSFLALSCQAPQESTDVAPMAEPTDRDELTGAWRMTDYLRIMNNGDTATTDNRVQYKVYVDGSVMWGFESPEEYTEWFGYGTYEIDGDTLYEMMTSGSWAFRQAISQNSSLFRIGIDVKENNYTQVIVDDEYTTYETYERVNN